MTSIARCFERSQNAAISIPSPRDRLLFGTLDCKIRERLLRETNPTLKKRYEICRDSEGILSQIKVVEDNLRRSAGKCDKPE